MTDGELAEYYRAYVRRHPENPEARMRLAMALREIGRRERAVEEFGDAARLLEERGRLEEAIAACKGVLELAPDHRETRDRLATLFAKAPDAGQRSGRVAKPIEGSDGGGRVGGGDAPASEERETTGGRERPQAPVVGDDAGDGTLDGAETVEIQPGEAPDLSREEMDRMLTTIDIGPEDIVEIDDLDDIESFEDDHGGRED